MVRNVAREIAIHLAYELSFTDQTVEELLDRRLTAESFESLAAEDAIYAEAPNDKQAAYIRRLVVGVEEHAAELDGYISKYAVGWSFARIPLVASAIMRVCMSINPNVGAVSRHLGKIRSKPAYYHFKKWYRSLFGTSPMQSKLYRFNHRLKSSLKKALWPGSTLFEDMAELRRRMDALRMDETEKARKVDSLRFQIDELERAELRPGEEEELLERRDLLRNGEKYLSAVSGADQCLNGDDETGGAVSLIQEAENALAHDQSALLR